MKQRAFGAERLLRFLLLVAFLRFLLSVTILVTMVNVPADQKRPSIAKQIEERRSKQKYYKAAAVGIGVVTGTALLGMATAAPVLTATGAAHGVSAAGMGALGIGGEAARTVLWEGAKAGGKALYREATAPIPPSPIMAELAKSAASN